MKTEKTDINWKEKNIQGMERWKVVVLYVGVLSFAAFLLVGFSKMKIEYTMTQGKINAQEILETMIQGDNLPWESTDKKILAVIECPEIKTIFIRSENETVGSGVMGCKYYVARDVEIELTSEMLKPNGLIKFKKISDE